MTSLNSVLSKKMHFWDLNQSKFEETDDFPLMSGPGPVCILLAAYLLFVLKIGPNYMMKRKPYKLTYTLVGYNALQVALSAFMVYRYFNDLLEMGLFPKKCHLADDKLRKHVLTSIWIYFAAKLTELLDTVFFILRKKNSQVTFLHLYHHSVMFFGTWATLKYWPSHNLVFIGFLNSLVHVLMYSYYGLSALGPGVAKYLTWKKYMTTFQLVQFVSIIIQYLVSVKVSDCPPSRAIMYFMIGNTAFFLLLFLNFYRQSYTKKDKVKATENHAEVKDDICVNGKDNHRNDVEKSYTLQNGNAVNKEKIK